jgi:prepilin-type N-terminal cleavage/methylation domain-containing protein
MAAGMGANARSRARGATLVNMHRAGGQRRSTRFTLIEILIVVSIIGLLMAIALPQFRRARVRANLNMCINNLRLIDAAKEQCAFESMGSVDDFAVYLKDEVVPTCSTDGSAYTIGDVDTLPTCPNADLGHYLQAPDNP